MTYLITRLTQRLSDHPNFSTFPMGMKINMNMRQRETLNSESN